MRAYDKFFMGARGLSTRGKKKKKKKARPRLLLLLFLLPIFDRRDKLAVTFLDALPAALVRGLPKPTPSADNNNRVGLAPKRH